MTPQSVYDTIVTHLRKQGSRSVHAVKYWKRDEIECAIHGDEDKKDPIGALLIEGEYLPAMEGWTFGSYLKLKDAPKALKDKYLVHAELIDELVFMHDFNLPETWEDEFETIASRHKLKYVKPVEENK